MFYERVLKANPDKFYLILSNYDSSINVDKYQIVLIVTMKNYYFNGHVFNLCKKACWKLHTLSKLLNT